MLGRWTNGTPFAAMWSQNVAFSNSRTYTNKQLHCREVCSYGNPVVLIVSMDTQNRTQATLRENLVIECRERYHLTIIIFCCKEKTGS